MKKVQVILGEGQCMCPCCGYVLRVGATVRLKSNREIGQMPIDEPLNAPERLEAMAEAERHG